MNPDASSTDRWKEEASDPRVHLAAERTLLAWVRTGLALMGFGFVVARFGLFLQQSPVADAKADSAGSPVSLWIGVLLVALGVGANLAAAVRHYAFIKALQRGTPRQARGRMALAFATAVGLLGIGIAAYLLDII